MAEMGGAGSGLSGDKEGSGPEGFIQPAGQAERRERGQDRGRPPFADHYLSPSRREENVYYGYDETIGCLDNHLTDSPESRSDLGLGAETECYGAHKGANRRVVYITEAAMKNKRKIKKGLAFRYHRRD